MKASVCLSESRASGSSTMVGPHGACGPSGAVRFARLVAVPWHGCGASHRAKISCSLAWNMSGGSPRRSANKGTPAVCWRADPPDKTRPPGAEPGVRTWRRPWPGCAWFRQSSSGRSRREKRASWLGRPLSRMATSVVKRSDHRQPSRRRKRHCVGRRPEPAGLPTTPACRPKPRENVFGGQSVIDR